LLAHAVEVLQWTHSFAERMSVGDGGRDIDFGQKHGFGQATAVRQMTG
jgi:hypothetical protein